MVLKPFLQINDHLTLHLARHELPEAIFHAVDSQRSYLRQWLPWVDGYQSVEDAKKYIRESMAHNSTGTRLITFVLAGEQLAGSVSVVNFNKDNKSCEIGYWLHHELQGQGIMTKACACLINHLFKAKDLNRIEMKIASGNVKSQAIPLRLNFQREGTLRQGLLLYDKHHDLELFSLLRNEWKSR